jgi:hypothetical protein
MSRRDDDDDNDDRPSGAAKIQEYPTAFLAMRVAGCVNREEFIVDIETNTAVGGCLGDATNGGHQ